MFEIQKVLADFIAVNENIDFDSLQNTVWVNNNISTLFLGCRSQNNLEYIYFVFDTEPDAGEKIELDSIVATYVGTPAPLTVLQQDILEAKKLVDSFAGDARAKYITVSPGQTAVYIEKEKQSKAFKDAGYPIDETGYEFVTANKNADGVTAQVAADTVLAVASGWKLIAAGIEEIRIGYKNQITAAVDINAVKALKNKAKALLDAI